MKLTKNGVVEEYTNPATIDGFKNSGWVEYVPVETEKPKKATTKKSK